MKNFVFVLIVTILMAGCVAGNTTQSALSVLTSATNISYTYNENDNEIVTFVDNAKLTEMETVSVLEAMDQVERSRARLIRYRDDALDLIQHIDKVTLQYSKIKSSYISVRFIVKSHWDEYDVPTQQVFLTFDENAILLDQEFTKLVGAIKSDQAIMTALNLATTSLRLASMM